MLTEGDRVGQQLNFFALRQKQVDRWLNSETDQQLGHRKDHGTRVQFKRGTIFLAACSQCDQSEVKELLQQGVDPNSTNCDGLTALHQACIDDNISMVEFLIKNGAHVNVADNEGWTPLHATASCGYIDIASYLVDKGANVSACNSDGDLPLDIAEGSDMENFLASVMNSQNINADEARTSEARSMLIDAKDWIKNPDRPELEDIHTGATALHVSSAKGYHAVMMVLIEAGANLNHQDFDGWTPLHGAAHWGQEDSCKILVEALCDMDIKDKDGKTAAEQADESLKKLMKELSEKQKNLRSLNKKDSYDDMVIKPRGQIVRRSSVTRMSNDDKEKLAHSASLEERGTVLAAKSKISEDLEAEESELQDKTTEDQKLAAEPKPEVKPLEVKVSQPEKPLSAREMKPSTPVAIVTPSTSGSTNTSTTSAADHKEDNDQFDEDTKSNAASSSAPTSSVSTGGASIRDKRAFAAVRDQGITDRSSYPLAARSNYVPYYKRQQMEREAKLKEDKQASNEATSGSDAAAAALSTNTSPNAALYRGDSEPEKNADRRISRFEAPKRDEEAETNRKIKAKRARETRRSTQGVTQDDVKAAEATLKIADTNGTSGQDLNSQSKVDTSVSNQEDLSSSSQENKTEEPSRRRAWQRDEGTRSSFRKARDTIISANNSSSSIPDTLASTSAYTSSRYSRNSAEITDERPERQRYSWRNSDRNGVDHKEGNEENKTKEEDDNGERSKSRNLRNRRNRRERRSTGVIYYDENDFDKNDDEKDRDTSETCPNDDPNTTANDSSNSTTSGWNSTRPFTSRRYGSASDVPSHMAANSAGERADRSSYGRYSSRRPPSTGTALDVNSEADYKKLFEETKSENEKLKTQVKSLQTEIADGRSNGNNNNRSRGGNSESLSDKREKRALERRISELEEEIKKMDVLKQDNTRLKEENGALIRVISKLSK